jgi:cytoskeletal protein CcmA (bactofilin family)
MVTNTNSGRMFPNIGTTFATSPGQRLPEGPPPRVVGPANGEIAIGSGVQVSGTISRCASIRVNGDLHSAGIHCELLRVAAGGHFTGVAIAAKAEISGTFQGHLTAEIVIVEGSAQVTADIEYGELEIARGAKVSGKLQIRK